MYSNVELLREVKRQTNKKEQLFKYLLLVLRTAFIFFVCLVGLSKDDDQKGRQVTSAVLLDQSRSSTILSSQDQVIAQEKLFLEDLVINGQTVISENRALKKEKVSISELFDKLSYIQPENSVFKIPSNIPKGTIIVSPFAKSLSIESLKGLDDLSLVKVDALDVQYPLIDSVFLSKSGDQYVFHVLFKEKVQEVRMNVFVNGALLNSSPLNVPQIDVELGQLSSESIVELQFQNNDLLVPLLKKYYVLQGFRKKDIGIISSQFPFIKNVYGDTTKFSVECFRDIKNLESLYKKDFVVVDLDETNLSEWLSASRLLNQAGVRVLMVCDDLQSFDQFGVQVKKTDTINTAINLNSTPLFDDVLSKRSSRTQLREISVTSVLKQGVRPILQDEAKNTLIGESLFYPNLLVSSIDLVSKNQFTLSNFWLPVAYKLLETNDGVVSYAPGSYVILNDKFKDTDEVLLNDSLALRVIKQGGTVMVALPDNLNPGFFELKTGGSKINIAVNFDYQRDDFLTYSTEELKQVLSTSNHKIYTTDDYFSAKKIGSKSDQDFKKWQWYLLIAIVLLFIEILIVRLKKNIQHV